MISNLARSVRETLAEAFPNTLVKEELYINYRGTRLFFDFHIPTLNILVEVQGRQHHEFVEHFHGTASNFRAAQKRDRLKVDYALDEEKTLVTIDHDEIPITAMDLLERIENKQNGR